MQKIKDVITGGDNDNNGRGGDKDRDSDSNDNNERRHGGDRLGNRSSGGRSNYSDFGSNNSFGDYGSERSYGGDYGYGRYRYGGDYGRSSGGDYDFSSGRHRYGGDFGSGMSYGGTTTTTRSIGDSGFGRSSYGGDSSYGSVKSYGGDYGRSSGGDYGFGSGRSRYGGEYGSSMSYGGDYDRSYGGEYRSGRSYGNNNALGFNNSSSSTSSSMSSFNPSAELSETDTEWHVHADLPGCNKSDVKVTCDNGKLTISGERSRSKEDDKGRTYHKTERSYGKFSRTMTLPYHVDNKDIRANFKNGVLEVAITKPQEYLNRRIDIS